MASLLRFVFVAGTIVLASCTSDPGSTECKTAAGVPTGIICPVDTQCAAAQPVCITTNCGNGVVDGNEECDDGNVLEGDDCSSTCKDEECGNGLTDPGEVCDDGNIMDGVGNCAANCLSTETCGNGVRNSGEACDDGDNEDADGCSANCKSTEVCGNMIKDIAVGEICDDGNTTSGDGCNMDCRSGEGCGNGILDPGEECDDGNVIETDNCRVGNDECKIAVCGDGVEAATATGAFFEQCDGAPLGGTTAVETMGCNIDCTDKVCGDGKVNQTGGETCDNGSMSDTLVCDGDCTQPVCGDGRVNMTLNGSTPLEACDPGAVGANISTCDSNCTVPTCGDSHVNNTFTPTGGTVPEGCDDGGNVSGDGCSALCQIESCGNGVIEMVNGEQCDDANSDDLDACRNNCQSPRCGDGIESNSEICDTNGNTATCDHDCTLPQCGDTVTNPAFQPSGGMATENCDDGGTAAGDGCSATCRIESCGNGVTEAVNGEQCDDMNTDDLDGCRNNCQLPRCLDGVESASETCDTNGNSATCDSDCTAPMCDDAIMNPAAGEQCEDGNLTNGDGCSSSCQLEPFPMTIVLAGNGTGTVTSNPAGINCGADCSELYLSGTMVTLTASAGMQSTFMGWSGGGCTGTGTCMTTMNAAKTIMATFQLNTLTVTKSGDGTGTVTSNPAGISCGADCDQVYNSGTMVTLTAAPSSDSTFTGWSGGGCSGTAPCTVTMAGARTVNAQFTLQTFALTVSKNGNGTGTVESVPTGIDCGPTCMFGFTANTMVTLVATPAMFSNFTGWSGSGCSGTGNCVVTMSMARAVTATFTLQQFDLDVTVNGNGTVTSNPAGINCGGDCDHTYNATQTVTLTAAPAGQQAFIGWSGGGCSGTGNCVVVMDSAKSVTATFAPNRLTVVRAGNGTGTVTSIPAGINCGNDCINDYNTGTLITLTAVAATPGSRFAGWSGGGCSGTGTCMVTLDTPTTITATFVDQDTLTISKNGGGVGTVTSSPAGINCGAICSGDFDDGTMITLTAAAASGSVFTGWSGAGCSGTGTCIFNLTSNTTVTATFEQEFTLTVTKAGTGASLGTVQSSPAGIDCGLDCTEDYVDGQSVVLTATTTGGATFSGWSGVPGCPGTGSCTVSMTQARNVTATFAAPPMFALTVTNTGGGGTSTVTSAPAGISCGADCTENYTSGTMVTLTANFMGGDTSVGWAGCATMTATTCTVTMDMVRNVTATFAP